MPEKPRCPECESELTCKNCDDRRPKAEDIYAPGQIRSPFGRWETITRVDQPDRFGPVRVWTEETGPGFSWRYNRWDHVDFVPALVGRNGAPEVRVIEWAGRDGFMYAIAIGEGQTYGLVPKASSVLV